MIANTPLGMFQEVLADRNRLIGEMGQLRAELELAESKLAAVRVAVEAAWSAANGRWSEWGSRALDVADHLDTARALLRAPAPATGEVDNRCAYERRDGYCIADGHCPQHARPATGEEGA